MNHKQWLDPDQPPLFTPERKFQVNSGKDREPGLRSFTTTGVISWLSSIRLPLVPIDAAFLPGENYTEVESIKKDLDSYFSSRPESFCKRGIQSLPEGWEKVILNEGNYFDDWFVFILFLWSNKIRKKTKLLIVQPNKKYRNQ